ncbi:MAG: hypothetical protein L0Y72_11615 [Gemmataceae bacterium]|nr:hypothetical protein [Gemmataceae bacterium]
MTDTGHPEDDPFLLRYGLTVPGTQRGIVPPLKVLEENRGGFSARRQREAEGEIRRLQEALAIGRFFFSHLDGDSQQAILELTALCNRLPRACDAELLLEFRQLSEVQAEQLADDAMRCVDAEDKPLVDVGTQILQRLACFRDAGLTEATCDALIARSIFWPSSLYRDASDSVASRLVELIDKVPDELALNHLLLALAWTRSEAAPQAFRTWSQHVPRWADSLHVPVQEYSPSAGWCLDEAGNRRDVISLDCYRLVGPSDSATANVTCRKTLSDNCPSCGGPQGVLFDFTEANEDRFTGVLAEAPRRVSYCLHCSCYGAVFTRYYPDGTTDWLSPIEPSEFAYEDGYSPKPCYRTLEPSAIPPFAYAHPFGLADASTLGGIPMWLQDARFPRCIDCGRLMTFLAQHDNGPLGEEGIYYAFFCAECRVAGVTYQQT